MQYRTLGRTGIQVSPYALGTRIVHLFRAGLSLPPHKYQLAQRLKLARRLLERGCGIAETAARTGFFDQSHFHRHFRRGFGLSPRAYQNLVRADDPVVDETAPP